MEKYLPGTKIEEFKVNSPINTEHSFTPNVFLKTIKGQIDFSYSVSNEKALEIISSLTRESFLRLIVLELVRNFDEPNKKAFFDELLVANTL